MLQKLTYSGTAGRSFTVASDMLWHLADWKVDPKQVERITELIGAERVAERDAQVAAFAAKHIAAVLAKDLLVVART